MLETIARIDALNLMTESQLKTLDDRTKEIEKIVDDVSGWSFVHQYDADRGELFVQFLNADGQVMHTLLFDVVNNKCVNLTNDDIVKNALVNAFVDYYSYKYLGITRYHMIANREDIRRINIHMKLTGKNWFDEFQKFIPVIDELDDWYDFGLDHYDCCIPITLFVRGELQ